MPVALLHSVRCADGCGLNSGAPSPAASSLGTQSGTQSCELWRTTPDTGGQSPHAATRPNSPGPSADDYGSDALPRHWSSKPDCPGLPTSGVERRTGTRRRLCLYDHHYDHPAVLDHTPVDTKGVSPGPMHLGGPLRTSGLHLKIARSAVRYRP